MADDQQLIDRLRQVDLFSGLTDRGLKAIARAAAPVDHQAGREIVEQGGGHAGFHVIVEGRASVHVHGQHRRDLGPGDYFGEISLIDGKPRSATVRAETPLRTQSIVSWDFHQLLGAQPDLARALLVTLCARLRDAETDLA